MDNLNCHALALARQGNWTLADLIEVASREWEEGFVGIFHVPGDRPLLGYSLRDPNEPEECLACDGEGRIRCDCCGQWTDCDECDGSGEADTARPNEVGDVNTWRTFDGEAVEVTFQARREFFVAAESAVASVGEYRRLVAWLAAHAITREISHGLPDHPLLCIRARDAEKRVAPRTRRDVPRHIHREASEP